MEYPLISVIVPVYNVEKYLRRCIDSLLTQTYPNLEIILVNDGSSDNSWEICQEYEATQPSVRALKKPNGGLSSARNFGLNSALGQYIGFSDSDDWITRDMYEYLYSLLSENRAEAAQVEYELAYDDQHKFRQRNEKIETICGKDRILEYYMEKTTTAGDYSVCICLFDSKVAKKYKFREGKTAEDMDYKFNVLSECTRFVSSNQAKYHYFQAGSSTSSGILIQKNFELYESAEILCQLCNCQKSKRTQFLGKVKKARTAFSLLSKAAFYGISDEIDKAQIDTLIQENRRNLPILLKAPLPLSRKITTIAFAINFHFAKNLISCYKKISGGKI